MIELAANKFIKNLQVYFLAETTLSTFCCKVITVRNAVKQGVARNYIKTHCLPDRKCRAKLLKKEVKLLGTGSVV
jgi:hypothetical protein